MRRLAVSRRRHPATRVRIAGTRWPADDRSRSLHSKEGHRMADVAFVALIIVAFGLLLLTIRGLEKL